jgi:hypothetical protein
VKYDTFASLEQLLAHIEEYEGRSNAPGVVVEPEGLPAGAKRDAPMRKRRLSSRAPFGLRN